jgi:hypothetical protein
VKCVECGTQQFKCNTCCKFVDTKPLEAVYLKRISDLEQEIFYLKLALDSRRSSDSDGFGGSNRSADGKWHG